MIKKIDEAVTKLKKEIQQNFNGKNFDRITHTAYEILHKAEEAGSGIETKNKLQK